jgi:hypothetical protein
VLGIFVDIDNELGDIAKESKMLADSVEIYRGSALGAEPAWIWLTVQGPASGVEKVYTGCERVMSKIAAEIDGAKVDPNEGWHVSLLKRMVHPFPGVREAVISEECFKELDRLRAFRHRERNSYGLVLDPEIVLERAVQASEAFEKFRSEVSVFAEKMVKPNTTRG